MIRRIIKIISVDLQKDFSSEGGICYRPRPSVIFVNNTLVPFLRAHKIRIAEIISDYRQPRPGDKGDCCRPGEWGYESEIPEDVKLKDSWVKCMNSPVWTRKNIGLAGRRPGLPSQDTDAFGRWLRANIGRPEDVDEVVLIGLTVDCCVLCTAQELSWRGYAVRILEEAVDAYSGNQQEKRRILSNPPLTNWAKPISWNALRGKL